MVSPTTLKRKCPGSMIPACTGPTGISKMPSPSTSVNGNGPPVVLESRGDRVLAEWEVVVGPECVADERPRIRVARGSIPNRSWISRSKRDAGYGAWPGR